MGVIRKVKRAVRGEVAPRTALLEAARRGQVSLGRWIDLANLKRAQDRSVRLQGRFAKMTRADLVFHYRNRESPRLFNGLTSSSFVDTHRSRFETETRELIEAAQKIVNDHAWPLLGFGVKNFGQKIEWRRDPLSSYHWPLEYHRDIKLTRTDGSDARALWEVNRLGHLLTLARAYHLTGDEQLTREFFAQVDTWNTQNPIGRGPNWACAMEVALRAINLLGAFDIFRKSPELEKNSLTLLLNLFDKHGIFIRRNLEFSYIATSNHYLSDVVGLLWLGILLPEFRSAKEWREFGFRELLREMDKQILDDGADFESSTGYHRFVLELFLFSFLLCRANGLNIDEHYWRKLQSMLQYLHAYLRPDGFAPLIGDTDGGQVLPLQKHVAHDHAYLLPIGAVVFNDPELNSDRVTTPQELLWLSGEEAMATFEKMPAESKQVSKAFPSAGTYIMRDENLYLCFNTSGTGINGRGSHGHNDALSIEVTVGERPFIVDPGTYVYTSDLKKRHQFRSTAFHSTVQIDNLEQNTTSEGMPFIIGDEARPRILLWKTTETFDKVSAEHSGYARLSKPVIHRRSITFNKVEAWWLVEDEFLGEGEHEFKIRFHFDAGLELTPETHALVALDVQTGITLSVTSLDLDFSPSLEPQFVSRDYGTLESSVTACWQVIGKPQKLTWRIAPLIQAGSSFGK